MFTHIQGHIHGHRDSGILIEVAHSVSVRITDTCVFFAPSQRSKKTVHELSSFGSLF